MSNIFLPWIERPNHFYRTIPSSLILDYDDDDKYKMLIWKKGSAGVGIGFCFWRWLQT